jgi:RHS repeat-associated protein
VPDAQSWIDQPCGGLTYSWLTGSYPNNGFGLWGDPTKSYQRKFRSSEYGTSTDRPRLVVNYEVPTAAITNTAAAYRVGDMVRVTVAIKDTVNLDKIKEIRLGINRAASDASTYRGVLDWCSATGRSDPADTWDDWRTSPYKDSGGYFGSLETGTDPAGSRFITPALKKCTYNATTGTADFYFRINHDFGSSTNRFAIWLKMANSSTGELWTSGWMSSGYGTWPTFAVQAPVTAAVSGSTAWFTETDANHDGMPDNPDNSDSQGRGNVSLSWPTAMNADGYAIFLFDGLTYQKVGQVATDPNGPPSYSWSSSGLNFFPTDSDVQAKAWTSGWAAGVTNANPFWRTTSPSDATQLTSVTSTYLNSSAGVIASDGSYLYTCGRQGRTDGTTSWQKFSATTGARVSSFGTISGRPLTAFCLYPAVYPGYVTTDSSGTATVRGNVIGSSSTSTLTFVNPGGNWSLAKPLDRDSGALVANSTSTGNVLFASDGSKLYSFSSAGGFKWREYTLNSGAGTATWTCTDYQIPAASTTISGVMVDAKSIYLIGWTADNSATITKIDRTTRTIVNQWCVNQATTTVCTGAYASDGTNKSFWMGSLTAGKLYKYAVADGGFDMRDNPNGLYNQTGTKAIDWTHYSFQVVPYSGTAPASLSTTTDFHGTIVTLANRTNHPSDAPLHPVVGLNSFDGNGASLRLDSGALAVSTTDLSIASWGPPAALSRVYLSVLPSGVTTTRFAPGWRFNFERNLDVTNSVDANNLVYYDTYGDRWNFPGKSSPYAGPYAGPYGTASWLEQVGSDWRLHRKDGSYLEFNANGQLTKEVDAQGNCVIYTWTGTTDLLIKAANGQKIDVTFDANRKITQVVYQNGDGWTLPATRTVTYAPSGSDWTVEFLNTRPNGELTDDRTSYSYSGGTLIRIGAETRPDQNSAWSDCGHETFGYGTNGLSSMALPETDMPVALAAYNNAAARIEITDDPTTRQAQITRHGLVSSASASTNASASAATRATDPPGIARDAQLRSLTTTYHWNVSGTIASVLAPSADGSGNPTAFTYAATNALAQTTSPMGRTSEVATDVHGNVIATADELGHGTVFVYPSFAANTIDTNFVDNLPLVTVDAVGAAAYFSYDAAGNVTSTKKDIGETQVHPVDVSLPYFASLPTPATPFAETDITYVPVYFYNDGTAWFAQQSGRSGELVMHGAVGQTTTKTDTSHNTVTNYGEVFDANNLPTNQANIAICGQPQSQTNPAVQVGSHWDPIRHGGELVADSYDLTQTSVYDNFGELLTRTNTAAAGEQVVMVTNTYDPAGRLKTSASPSAAESTGGPSYVATKHFTYDGLGNVSESWITSNDSPPASPRLNDVINTYSPSGWLLKQTLCDGTDASGTLSTTSYTYDGEGNQVSANDSTIGGSAARTDYDYHANVVAAWHEGVPDYDYRRSSFAAYNADDQKTASWSPGAGATASVTYALNLDGSLARQTDDNGGFTAYGYDAAGQLVSQRTPTETYDSSTHKLDLSIATSEYDLLGDVTRSIDPGGVKTTTTYDLAGRQIDQMLLTPEPADGSAPPDDGSSGLDNAETTTIYNSLGWVLKEIGVNDISTATSYNTDGSVALHVEGNTATFRAYNAAGQTLEQQVGSVAVAGQMPARGADPGTWSFAVGRETDYTYSGFGQMTKQKGFRPGDANRAANTIETVTSYDPLGRVTDTTKTQGTTSPRVIYHQHLDYFLPANPTSIIQTTTYGEPGNGPQGAADQEITQVEQISPGTNAYSYTAQIGLNSPSVTGSDTTHDYADNVTATALSLPGGSGVVSAHFTYDHDSRLIDRWGSGLVQLGSGDNYVYNAFSGRLTAETLPVAATGNVWDDPQHHNRIDTPLFSDINHTFTYDKSGRIKLANDIAYTFNGGGALTKIVNGSVTTAATYTQRQRLNKVTTTGAPDSVVVWDMANGRRASQGVSGANQTLAYSYLADDLPGQIVDSSTSTHTTSIYAYDGDGQRLNQTVTHGSTQTTTTYTYIGLQLMALHVHQTYSDGSSDYSISYLYDDSGNPVAGYFDSPDSGSQWFAIVTNQRGDVIELLDQWGSRFASYRYTVWGAPQGTNNGILTTPTPVPVGSGAGSALVSAAMAQAIANAQPLRYAGYAYDQTTGLYYVGARYYDPATAQFISRDPAKADGAQSAYQYAQDNPTLTVDPSGLHPISYEPLNSQKEKVDKKALAALRAAQAAWDPNHKYMGFDGTVYPVVQHPLPSTAQLILRTVLCYKEEDTFGTVPKYLHPPDNVDLNLSSGFFSLGFDIDKHGNLFWNAGLQVGAEDLNALKNGNFAGKGGLFMPNVSLQAQYVNDSGDTSEADLKTLNTGKSKQISTGVPWLPWSPVVSETFSSGVKATGYGIGTGPPSYTQSSGGKICNIPEFFRNLFGL